MDEINNDAVDVTETILESISDGVFTVNLQWRIMSFNRAAEEITGISRDEAIGRYCWEVFRSNMCEGDCALKRTMKEKRAFLSTSTYIINSEKNRIPISVSTALLQKENGEIIGGVETFRDNTLVEELRKELDGKVQLGDMISRSPLMKDIFSVLPQIAESDSTVLIEGETGTGKEMMARALHDYSLRSNKPFVAINCGALPDTLLESELFGYKKGAFTSAVKDKEGFFTAAAGGTILLDELGETSPAFQVKLLRVLEEREYQPLGSTVKKPADVRVIAATNKNLTELVESGKFRRDLFYRVNIVRLNLPALKKRKEDIPLLADIFIKKGNRLRGNGVTHLSDEAMQIILQHDFPGNIRELENIIEHSMILCKHGVITADFLSADLKEQQVVVKKCNSSTVGEIKKTVNTVESEMIISALNRNHFNRTATAKELGMHKSTFFRKVKKLGITLPPYDGRSVTSTR